MRRNKKSGINKERIIMLASSAFVLAALTMTGVYMKGQNVESRDDGYTLDFTALPNNADDKLQEITENSDEHLLKEDDRQKEETGGKQTAGGDVVVEKTLHFAESDGLQQPVQSDILMHYSMDKSTYFATLDQYKYNPATIFSAEEGTAVTACAQGKVTSIFENEEIGKAVTLDLGDGYEATYGQLTEITVKENSYVNPGDTIGSVAAPTKYYSAEGSNVYFALTHNGEPVNGEALFR